MKALEQAMDALVLLTLQLVVTFHREISLLLALFALPLFVGDTCSLADRLPESVLWFEPPLVAHWLPKKKIWSTKHVHDVKFNEEKQTIAFRTGRLGIHGLAGYKYANLPFQSWELKPEMGKSGRDYAGVILIVTAATVQAEFVVRVLSIISE